ncbi:MAG: TonB-dependent receptor [Marinobacterium sp.]|nr:TonB-dependent receptor [Marinobacterium sp.]
MFNQTRQAIAVPPTPGVQPLSLAIAIALSTTVLSTTMLSTAALASEQSAEQTSLGAIVVRAEKRSAELQDVPASITAVTTEEIADAEINSLTEVARQTPNLHIMTWAGRRDTNIFIRGIGPGLFTPPTAGVYLDGVNLTSNGMFDFDMLDIETIEVLRGPQGSLYGGNSLAGIVNVTTRSPDAPAEGKISLRHDDLGRTQFQARYNDALIEDELFASISTNLVDDSGNIDNLFFDEKLDQRDDRSLRTKLMWQPHDDFSATLALDVHRFRGGSYAFTPLDTLAQNPQQVSHNYRGRDDQDSWGSALTLEWQLQGMTLTSVTSWRDWENFNSSDSDGMSMDAMYYHALANEEHDQLTQELRLASEPDGGPLNWLAGLYYYSADSYSGGHNTMNFGTGDLVDRNTFNKEQSGYAVFGQLDYALNDQWMLTTGLRYDDENRKLDGSINAMTGASGTLAGDKDFSEWLPKAVLSWQPDDELMVYGSVSKGYRAGGFDDLYPNLDDIEYDSEKSINYELGFKQSLLNDQLQLNAAVYYIDLSNQQVQKFIGSQVFTENAGASTSKGMELEARYIPAPGWLLMAGLGYNDASFDRYNSCSIADCSGNAMPFAPDWTGNLSIQNRQPLASGLDLFSRVDWQHTGEHYFDAANRFKQDAYSLVNLKVGVEADSWEAYLWSKNLFDEEYVKIAFDQGFGPMASAGEPRAVGVTMNLLF